MSDVKVSSFVFFVGWRYSIQTIYSLDAGNMLVAYPGYALKFLFILPVKLKNIYEVSKGAKLHLGGFRLNIQLPTFIFLWNLFENVELV